VLHDINFHRAIGVASCNPIVASLMEMVAALYYEQRRDTASRAVDRDLREAAEMHRRIYQAIRDKNPDRARSVMNEHLLTAQAFQAQEEQAHLSEGSEGPGK
jgi:GntR family transcriptional regulator, transcriptional repressor for pyruvate dehydrogenase complex